MVACPDIRVCSFLRVCVVYLRTGFFLPINGDRLKVGGTMRPQDVKYYPCPRCRKQATVLVGIKDNAHFCRDDMGNIQYQCTNCQTTFSVDRGGHIVTIKPGSWGERKALRC